MTEQITSCPDCGGINTIHANEGGHMHDCLDCGAAWNPTWAGDANFVARIRAIAARMYADHPTYHNEACYCEELRTAFID